MWLPLRVAKLTCAAQRKLFRKASVNKLPTRTALQPRNFISILGGIQCGTFFATHSGRKDRSEICTDTFMLHLRLLALPDIREFKLCFYDTKWNPVLYHVKILVENIVVWTRERKNCIKSGSWNKVEYLVLITIPTRTVTCFRVVQETNVKYKQGNKKIPIFSLTLRKKLNAN